ncbi:MAG: homocysteine S-methyltransferase family protein [Candidatus Dormibacteraeota bacterium]|nr:homocysteine S-methyltransferase family protein [Candidatus Dormibacteraeota bacterium]
MAAPIEGSTTESRDLRERLRAGPVICAEGYLFECERRGYLQAGAFVPEVVLEHPELVTELHREFVHAGSDVVEAFTYYAHREKLRIIGRGDVLEELNRQALRIAASVARETATLLAGNLSNTNVWSEDPTDQATARSMLEDQAAWAVDAGVDFIIGETFSDTGEALAATEIIRRTGLPSVVTMAIHRPGVTRDGLTAAEACRRLESAGADVVGLNCARGPRTMLPLLGAIRSSVSCPVAALPVPYRTTEEMPTFQSLRDPERPEQPFPTRLDPFTCTRDEIGEFAAEALALGVTYLGVCCGAGPHHIRSMAEAIGRRPPASRFSADMSKHAFYGTDASLKAVNTEFARDL